MNQIGKCSFSWGVSNTGKAGHFPALQGWTDKVAELSFCFPRVLQHLEQSHWLDRLTRSLFVEFVVFNANVNLFCVVTLILESNSVGMTFSSLLSLFPGYLRVPISYTIKRRLIKVTTHNFKSQIVQGKASSPHSPPHSCSPEMRLSAFKLALSEFKI